MLAYVVRRLLQTVPTVFGVILVLFLIFHVVGGNPVRAMLGKHATTQLVRDIEHRLGYDLPLLVNLDAAEAGARREAAAAALDVLVAVGPAPTRAIPDLRTGPALTALYEGYRSSVPMLVATVLEEAAPPARREWADAALEFVTGERVGYRAAASPEVRAAAVERWRRWWGGRADRVAFTPAWSNVLRSQLFRFFWEALTLDFGRSLQRRQTIWEAIRQGAPASLAVTVPGFFLSLVLALGLALVCAFRRGTWLDRSIVVLTVLGMSVTMLAYIIGGQYLLAAKLGCFPIQGFRSPWVPYVALPVILFVVVSLGPEVRFYRTAILDEVKQDYVRTARAKGVSTRGVMLRHVLKNAMIPILTYVVIAIPFLFMGSLLLERFFGIPGLGSIMVEGIFSADLPVVQAFTYIGAVLYVLGNLATDLCYALVDPRVSLR